MRYLAHLAHGGLGTDMEQKLTNDENRGEYLKHCEGELTTSWMGVWRVKFSFILVTPSYITHGVMFMQTKEICGGVFPFRRLLF